MLGLSRRSVRPARGSTVGLSRRATPFAVGRWACPEPLSLTYKGSSNICSADGLVPARRPSARGFRRPDAAASCRCGGWSLSVGLPSCSARASRACRGTCASLADAGAVERRQEGSWVFLTIADEERTDPMFALVDAWTDAATEHLFEDDAAKLDAVRAERAEAATRWPSPALPARGIRSARSTSPKARSSRRSAARSARTARGGWWMSAPAPAG